MEGSLMWRLCLGIRNKKLIISLLKKWSWVILSQILNELHKHIYVNIN